MRRGFRFPRFARDARELLRLLLLRLPLLHRLLLELPQHRRLLEQLHVTDLLLGLLHARDGLHRLTRLLGDAVGARLLAAVGLGRLGGGLAEVLLARRAQTTARRRSDCSLLVRDRRRAVGVMVLTTSPRFLPLALRTGFFFAACGRLFFTACRAFDVARATN